MKQANYLLFGLLLLLGLSACGGGKNDIYKHVPSNALTVGSINVPVLMKKGDFEALKQREEYKRASKRIKEAFRAYAENPAELGFDLESPAAYYSQVTSLTGGVNAALLIPIKDEAKVNKFMELLAKAEDLGELQSGDGFKFHKGKEAQGEFIGWSKKLFAVGTMRGMDGAEAQKKGLDALFNPKDKGITANAGFKKHLALGKDVMFWSSSEEFMKMVLNGDDGPTLKMGLGFFGLSENDLLGNELSATHDFQNGKIESVASLKFSEGFKKEFGATFKAKSSENYGKYLPADKLIGVMNAAVDVQVLYQALSKRRLDSRIDQPLQAVGLSAKDLFEALSGEGLIAVYAPQTSSSSDPSSPANAENLSKAQDKKDAKVKVEPEMNIDEPMYGDDYSRFGVKSTESDIVFISGVKNKASIEKLFATPEMAMMSKKNGDIINVQTPTGENWYIYLSDKLLLITDKAEVATQAAAGGYSNGAAPAQATAHTGKGWASFYVDLKAQAGNQLANDPVGRYLCEQIPTIEGWFEAEKATVIVGLKESGKNSLAQLADIIIESVKLDRKNRMTPQPATPE